MSSESVEAGERTATARDRLGFTQAEIAKRVGVTQATVSRWESGDRELSLSELPRVAAALEVSPLLFLGPAFGGADYAEGYNAGWDGCARAVAAAARRPDGGAS